MYFRIFLLLLKFSTFEIYHNAGIQIRISTNRSKMGKKSKSDTSSVKLEVKEEAMDESQTAADDGLNYHFISQLKI